ncbi:MAG: hypothetical protein AAFQ80_19570 [Cyanobacteria bacterium J06621_8]
MTFIISVNGSHSRIKVVEHPLFSSATSQRWQLTTGRTFHQLLEFLHHPETEK